MTSYSIDVLKRSAFQHEINNILNDMKTKLELGCAAHSHIVSYMQRRIHEIDKEHGKN